MKKNTNSSGAEIATIIAFALLALRLITVAEDIQVIVNDPNKNNKPTEVLKLFFDVSRLAK